MNPHQPLRIQPQCSPARRSTGVQFLFSFCMDLSGWRRNRAGKYVQAEANSCPFALCFSLLREDTPSLHHLVDQQHSGAPYKDSRGVLQKFHLQFCACAGYTGSLLFPSMVALMLWAMHSGTCIIWVFHSSGGAAPSLLQIMESNCWTKLILTYLHPVQQSYTRGKLGPWISLLC